MTIRDVIKTELRELARWDMGIPASTSIPVLSPAVRLDRFPHHDGLPRCRVCGCSDDDCTACVEASGEPCHWAEADLCSRCAGARHDDEDIVAESEIPDYDDSWCDTCHNTGVDDCLCGGDLCVCKHGGEVPCPDC